VDLLDLARNPLTSANDLADAVSWCTEASALPALICLVEHGEAQVRRSVAQALPRIAVAPRPQAVIDALIVLSADEDGDVRDWACYALGSKLSEVDSAELCDALAARLDDPDPHARCEALLGLARRKDARALPAVGQRLAGAHVRLPEVLAAGALGDASLHVLVRKHLAGWGPDAVPKVCAALRLTDPDGVGEDVLGGLADWYATRTPNGAAATDRYWWSIALNLIEQAPDRSVEIAEAVRLRLINDGYGTARLLSSHLAATAATFGWPHLA
jgi:hypothetical protein